MKLRTIIPCLVFTIVAVQGVRWLILHRELEALQDESAALAARLSIAREDADHARLVQNRDADLKAKLQDLLAGEAKNTPAAAPPNPQASSVVRKAAELTNAGLGSPASAAESMFWALNNGESGALREIIVMNPSLKQLAEGLFARLPDEKKAELKDPQGVIAFLLAAGTSVRAIEMNPDWYAENGPNLARLGVKIEYQDGVKRDARIEFVKDDGGAWKWAVPTALIYDNFSGIFTGRFPTTPAK